MVLKEIGELVVEKDGAVQFCGNIKLDNTLSSSGDVSDRCVGGIVEESVSGRRWFGIAV
jgi:hypothetical protein